MTVLIGGKEDTGRLTLRAVETRGAIWQDLPEVSDRYFAKPCLPLQVQNLRRISR